MKQNFRQACAKFNEILKAKAYLTFLNLLNIRSMLKWLKHIKNISYHLEKNFGVETKNIFVTINWDGRILWVNGDVLIIFLSCIKIMFSGGTRVSFFVLKNIFWLRFFLSSIVQSVVLPMTVDEKRNLTISTIIF